MTVWFTSDWHLLHRRVAGLRGFASIDEHDQCLVDHYCQVVKPDDLVWMLGDLAPSSPAVALSVLDALPGRKRLVAGNHDGVHPMYRQAPNRMAAYAQVFEYVTLAQRTKVMGIEVLLSHFPYERDREGTEPRHTQWRLRDEGLPLLHGHTHGTERLTVTPVDQPGEYVNRKRVEVHVGLDAWGLRPVSDAEVFSLLNAGQAEVAQRV